MNKIFIIDTNVLIAGLLTKNSQSPTAKIVDSILNGKIIFILSPELLQEYFEVLSRPKLIKLHGLSDKEIEQILSEVTANAIWLEVDDEFVAPDPGDSHLWNLLMKHKDYTLVTGDQLLIEQAPLNRSVISPATYVKLCLGNLDMH